jgi:hypothetical protein
MEKRNAIKSAFEQYGLRINLFRKHERVDVDEALLKWFKQEISDNVPVSGPLLLITFCIPIPKF